MKFSNFANNPTAENTQNTKSRVSQLTQVACNQVYVQMIPNHIKRVVNSLKQQ